MHLTLGPCTEPGQGRGRRPKTGIEPATTARSDPSAKHGVRSDRWPHERLPARALTADHDGHKPHLPVSGRHRFVAEQKVRIGTALTLTGVEPTSAPIGGYGVAARRSS
jgi:hypothetical protein